MTGSFFKIRYMVRGHLLRGPFNSGRGVIANLNPTPSWPPRRVLSRFVPGYPRKCNPVFRQNTARPAPLQNRIEVFRKQIVTSTPDNPKVLFTRIGGDIVVVGTRTTERGAENVVIHLPPCGYADCAVDVRPIKDSDRHQNFVRWAIKRGPINNDRLLKTAYISQMLEPLEEGTYDITIVFNKLFPNGISELDIFEYLATSKKFTKKRGLIRILHAFDLTIEPDGKINFGVL